MLHLLDLGVEKMVRLGSRSSDERIKALSLEQAEKSRAQRLGERECYTAIDACKESLILLNKRLVNMKVLSWEELRPFLQLEMENLYNSFAIAIIRDVLPVPGVPWNNI